MIQKFETDCDMGCVKIFNETMSIFFSNDMGDGTTDVYIQDERLTSSPDSPPDPDIAALPFNVNEARFLGHFTVKTTAYLSEYDCSDTPIYTFRKGRWFVHILEAGVVKIDWTGDDDEDLRA